MLVLVAVPPTWRLHVKIRPVLSFPPGVARRAGGLVTVGIIDFIANDLNTLVVIALANGHGETGAIVIFNYCWMVFTALYSVLAVAVTVSAFPVLSAREGAEFDRTCAGSTRAVVLLSWLGTAVIAAISVSTAHVLARNSSQVSQLISGFAAFAPGLIGIGLVNHLSRVMLAIGRLKVAAVALAASWLLAIVASFILVELVPAHWVVAALALGTTIGQCVVAIPLLIWTRRICGPRAVAGVTHAGFAGLAAALAGSLAGVAVSARPAGQPQGARRGRGGVRRGRRRAGLRRRRLPARPGRPAGHRGPPAPDARRARRVPGRARQAARRGLHRRTDPPTRPAPVSWDAAPGPGRGRARRGCSA